jgi:hypothetical protein
MQDIEDAMRRDTAATPFWDVPFVGCVCWLLIVFCELQNRGSCLDVFVCLPGSWLVLGGSLRFFEVFGLVHFPTWDFESFQNSCSQ